MKKMTIEATVPQKKDEKGNIVNEAMAGSVVVNYAETVKEAVEMFGEEAILTNAFANWRVVIQGGIRSGLRKGEAPEQLQQRLGDAKMGVTTQGAKIDVRQTYLGLYKMASPEEKKRMLAELQERTNQ